MEIVASKGEVLERLQTNLAKHKKVIEEARAAFVKRCRRILKKELKKVGQGRIQNMNVSLRAPEDHSGEYETAIEMMQLHVEDHVTLSTAEVRSLMMDKWDWMQQFLMTNYAFSNMARDLSAYHGIDAEAEMAAIQREEMKLAEELAKEEEEDDEDD